MSETDGGAGSSRPVVGWVGGGEDRGFGRTGDDAAVDEEEINWFSSPFFIGKFFTKLEASEAAQCNTCKMIIKTKQGNTSGLDSHLSRKHHKVYEIFLVKKAEVDAKRSEQKVKHSSLKKKVGQDLLKLRQTTLKKTQSGFLDMKAPPPNPRVQKEFTDALTNLAVECGISFRALSSPAFRNVVNILNKNSRDKVKVLDERNLARHVTKSAKELVQEITAIIKSCKDELEGIAFTTDIWTSPTMESFISLTVHFLDKNWLLHRWTPFVRHFPDRHTGAMIKLQLDEMIESLDLTGANTAKYVVNDNAANAVLAIKLSPDLVQILCAIHTLQLSIGDTFKDASVGSTKMKTILQKGKALANTVKRSGPLGQELKKACAEVNISYTSLKNPNDTRWNTEVTNLSSIIQIEKALVWLVNNDTIGQWTGMVFTPAEWRLAKAAVQVLQIPLRVTKMWEGEKYPTINLVCSELYGLKNRLEGYSSSSCLYTAQFAQELARQVSKRFPNCAAGHDIAAIANYVDPVFKGVHIEALGALQVTKNKILNRWGNLEESDTSDDQVDAVLEERDNDIDPTLLLIKKRKVSGEARGEVRKKSKLEKEMEIFEDNVGMDEIGTDGDRLAWWKKHEQFLPQLSKVAKHVLGIPCSSAKSERVFSTGGFMVTKRRSRLGAERVENLIVLKENTRLVEEFHVTDREMNVVRDSANDAFEGVEVLVEKGPVTAAPLSELFDDQSENEVWDASSDDEFDVVVEKDASRVI